eukprot:scaffold57769_cov32-Tisochrysis_lutea.AAC.1
MSTILPRCAPAGRPKYTGHCRDLCLRSRLMTLHAALGATKQPSTKDRTLMAIDHQMSANEQFICYPPPGATQTAQSITSQETLHTMRQQN